MPGATRVVFEIVGARGTGGKAELLDVSDQRLVVEDAIEFIAGNSQTENRRVPIHLRSDSRIEVVANSQFPGQRLNSLMIMHVCGHQHVGNGHPQPVRFQESNSGDGALP